MKSNPIVSGMKPTQRRLSDMNIVTYMIMDRFSTSGQVGSQSPLMRQKSAIAAIDVCQWSRPDDRQ